MDRLFKLHCSLSASSARRTLLVALVLVFSILATGSIFALSAPAARAACSSSDSTETCTGNANSGSADFFAPSIQTLTVNSVTQNLTSVSLTGSGTASGSGADGVPPTYSCSYSGSGGGASCSIDNARPTPTCTTTDGTNQTATCDYHTKTPAKSGPSGHGGPPVTVNASAPTTSGTTDTIG